MLNTDGSDTVGSCIGVGEWDCKPGSFYSSDYVDVSEYRPLLIVEEGAGNQPPVAEAGDNMQVETPDVHNTVIHGTATDPDDDALQYRWCLGDCSNADDVLSDWSDDVGANGEAYLEIIDLDLGVGEHTLTLEVREVDDNESNDSDTMVLTISPPGQNKDFRLEVDIPKIGKIKPKRGGTVTISWPDEKEDECKVNCSKRFKQGTEVTLKANPGNKYEYDCWDDGSECDYDDPKFITMDDDKTITARFLNSRDGIKYLCQDYGDEDGIGAIFLISAAWRMFGFGCGDFDGTPLPIGDILCTGKAIVGSGDDLGRCGPGDPDFGPDTGYTQDCLNHDLCVQQNKGNLLWLSHFTWSAKGPCVDEYLRAVNDYMTASDCTLY